MLILKKSQRTLYLISTNAKTYSKTPFRTNNGMVWYIYLLSAKEIHKIQLIKYNTINISQ